MLGPCLDSHSESPTIKKATAVWSSHTDSDKADFVWEIQGPRRVEVSPSARNLLQQRAKSYVSDSNTKLEKVAPVGILWPGASHILALV